MVSQITYQLVLVLLEADRVLLQFSSGEAYLPTVAISSRVRPAQHLQTAIKANWNLPTIVIDYLPSNPSEAIVVVSVRRSVKDIELPAELSAVSVDRIESVLTSEQYEKLQDILQGSNHQNGSFSRIGWIEETLEWIRLTLNNSSLEFSDDTLQLNAGSRFALIRFTDSAQRSYWLKATGVPNAHEYQVTLHLIKSFPKYMPSLLSARDDWNAWITLDCGPDLSDNAVPVAFELATAALARLQKLSLNRAQSLLAAGCFDHRAKLLDSDIDELFEYLLDAMEKQTSTKVPRIPRSRLVALRHIVHDSRDAVEEAEIPSALGHNDFNFGNILFDGQRCSFIDWSEGYIGNPFLTFEYFRGAVEKKFGAQTANSLLQIYKREWLEILNDNQVQSALTHAPLLAIASYLYGRGAWLRDACRNNPEFESYARSLARQMDHAAQELSLSRVS